MSERARVLLSIADDWETVERMAGMAVNRMCRQCRGTGVVRVRHGTIFCTDSADEIADAYHTEACPTCERDRKDALAAIARLRAGGQQ